MVNLRNCKLTELRELISTRKVLAYGTGSYLEGFTKRNPEIQLEKYIWSFVDRVCEDDNRVLNETSIPVKLLSDYYGEINQFTIIITSSVYCVEILERLDNLPELNGVEVYILTFVENTMDENPRSDLIDLKRENVEYIPPTIHYCWFGDKAMPYEQEKNIEKWREKCPNYEIRCWNETNYDVMRNPYVKKMWENRKWAFVTDFVRLDVLYNYGGIYLDTDVTLVQNLDGLRRFRGFIGREMPRSVASGLGVGSEKGNKIINQIRMIYINNDYSGGEIGVVPCPEIETSVFKEWGLADRNETQILGDNFLVLSTGYLGAMNRGTFYVNKKPYTVAIHDYAGSWTSHTTIKRKQVAESLCRRIGMI